MKGKILTIAGIVLIFGYFIMESFRNPSSIDPNQVVMVGKDTLGRDWGAMADQREREKKQQMEGNSSSGDNAGSGVNSTTGEGNENGKKSSNQYKDNNNTGIDPLQNPKLNASDYSSVQAADGREIITGYDPEQNDNAENYETSHQQELKRK